MHICYAHTKIQLNPISNFSDICKRNFQNPRDSKTHPRVSGMGKNYEVEVPQYGFVNVRAETIMLQFGDCSDFNTVQTTVFVCSVDVTDVGMTCAQSVSSVVYAHTLTLDARRCLGVARRDVASLGYGMTSLRRCAT